MKDRKTIAITGYTGVAGIVADKLLEDGRFNVRIIHQVQENECLSAMRRKGAALWFMPQWETDFLQDAFGQCWGVFGSTTDREYDRFEFEYGKKMIDAVKHAGIKHFVLETRPSYHAISNSVFSVPFFDSKALLEQYCKTSNIPASFIHPGFYYENFLTESFFHQDKTGELFFGFPQGNTCMAMTSQKDFGAIVVMIFRFPEQYIGRTVGIVGDERNCAEYASILTDLLRRKVEYRNIANLEYIMLGGSVDWADMFDVQRIFIRSRSRDLIESYGLNPAMQSFRRWVKRNKASILQNINRLGESTVS